MHKHPVVIVVSLVAAGLLIAVASLQYLPVPYVWGALSLACAFMFSMFAFKETRPRVVCFNLGMCCLILAAFETYCYVDAIRAVSLRSEVTDNAGGRTRVEHPYLGYAPRPNVAVHWKESFGAATVFDVRYTIDANARRTTPAPPVTTDDCVLFFGDSFTFGVGVNDEETLPYVTGVLAATRFGALNFAYPGYGPNQTLAALQHGVVQGTGCKPKHAFFLAIDDHAWRVSGRRGGRPAPEFVLGADGTVTFAGLFDDRWRRTALNAIRKSYLGDRVVIQPLDAMISEPEIDLMVAVLSASGDVLKQLTPSCQFHVVFWDVSPLGERIVSKLDAKRVNVHRVSDILPNFGRDRARYELSPQDPHPNALAHRLMAGYVNSLVVEAPRPPAK